MEAAVNNKLLTKELERKYRSEAAYQIDSDFSKVLVFARGNNIKCSLTDPREGDDYQQDVFCAARERWEADGYYLPACEFTKNSKRESIFFERILPNAS